MFLNQLEFQRYIQASAKRANLNVEWQEGVFPHTNGEKIVLPILPSSATELDYRKQLHYANHEVDHVLYTRFKAFTDAKCDAQRSFLGFIWNGVEDIRIEWLGGKEYEGDRSNTDEVYPALLERGLDSLSKATKEQLDKKKEVLDRVLPLMWWMNEANSEMYASAAQVAPHIEKHLSTEGKATIQKMKDGDYLEVLRNIRGIEDSDKGTRATFELAKRIYKEVYGLDPEKELERLQQPEEQQSGGKPQRKLIAKPQPKPEQKKDDKGDKGEAKPEDKDEKDGDNGKGKEGKGDEAKGEDAGGEGKDEKPDSGEGSGDGEGKEEGNEQPDGADQLGSEDSDGDAEGRDELVDVEYQEFLPNNHEMKPGEDRFTVPSEGLHIDYSKYRGRGNYVPATKDQFVVADFCRNQFDDPHTIRTEAYMESQNRRNYNNAMAGTAGAAFASRVRTRLQIRSKDRFEHGVKKGRLQNSLLHRVTVPDAPALNQRVFKRRIMSDTLDTAVCWLGDGSGSMNGAKYGHLTAASVQFNEAIGNTIQIPIEILSFTDVPDGSAEHQPQPLMYVHRDFACRRLATDELVRRMIVAGCHMASNPDGDAILWAYDRLRQRREKRKLLIVASDGQPATCRFGDIDTFTKQVVRQIENETPIEIVGIGIMDDNVSRIYKEHYVINDAAELEKALLALIDKKVR